MMNNFQYTQTAPWPIFGLALACADWAQRWMSVRGHAAREHFSLGIYTDYQIMKTGRLLLYFLLMLFATPWALAQPIKSPEKIISAWQMMWNTYDLLQVDKLFVADHSVTYFSSEYAGLIQGIEVLRDHHARFGFVDGGKSSENKLWLEEIRYKPSGQQCLVTATWYFQRAGSNQPQAGPVTFMLVKNKGGWRIQHAHFSNNP